MKKLLFIVLTSFILFCSCNNKKISEPKKIDYDFSSMNYNMASGILFDVLITPEKYINKTVKIYGQFNTQIHEGKRYYAVIIWDPTKCCPTGLTFIPPQNMNFPNDFPSEDDYITVTGFLNTSNYYNDEELYLIADSITVDKNTAK